MASNAHVRQLTDARLMTDQVSLHFLYIFSHFKGETNDGKGDLGCHRILWSKAQISLGDSSSDCWGHIDFADLKGDVTCA